jgi:queuine tRNA-ribosyltransferase
MQIQTVLNSDIVMQFDECTPYDTRRASLTTEAQEARSSMELSLRWAARSKAEFARLANPNALFGIVQGGMFENLREASLAALVELDCPATRWAASAWASPRTRCCASWRTRRTACRRTSRAT